jgi:hypothetical protein
MKATTKNRVTTMTVATAIALSAFTPAGLLRAQTAGTNAAQQQAQNSSSDLLKGNLCTTLASEDVRIGGKVIGKGSVAQELMGLDIGNNFSVGTWLDGNLDKSSLTECDLTADVHGKLAMPKKWFSGEDPFSWSLGFQRWDYPSGSVIKSSPDRVLVGSVAYNGFVDAKVTFTDCVTTKDTTGENNTDLDLSRQFSLGSSGKCKFDVTPTLRAGYDNRWFGGQGEFLTPGVVFGIGNNTGSVRLEAFVKRQISLDETIRNIPIYGGVRIKFAFGRR